MRSTLLLLAGGLLGSAAPAAAQRSPLPPPVRLLLETARHSDLRWPDFSDVQADLTSAYAGRGWRLLWTSPLGPTPQAQTLLQSLADAATRGLDPGDYDAAWLAEQAALLRGADSVRAARFDVGLSVAVARLAVALRRGRVSPQAVHAEFKLPAEPFALDSTLAALAAAERPTELLRSLEPPFIHYWLLMAALVRYRALARDSALVALPPMPRRLRPGEPYAGVATLRRLLRLLGDDRDTLSAPILDTLYTGTLVEAVQRFQMRQGFTPDGVIGDSTRDRLVHPFEARIRQMEVTLERWRWMPRRFSAPPIIVNIPAFRLYAFSGLQSDEGSLLRMNVVVGRAFKNETPVFAADLEYLIFSPYWDVTTTIALAEIKPQALKRPEFLTRNRYELVEAGEVVPPWPEHIARIGRGVRVRQTPGPANALGGVKFIMPNENQIYLHDTPSKALFERTRRDASHGCIRLGDPFALARFVLRDRPDWSDQRIRAAMNTDQPTRVDLTHPIPVFIVYATAIARESGEVYFYPDLYGHDRVLDLLLRHGYPYPR